MMSFKRKILAIAIVITTGTVLGGLAFAVFSGHRHGTHQFLDSENGTLSGDSLYQLESKWVDDSGDILALRDFAGQPVVMAMIYTSCEYACPLIVADMMKIYNGLSADKQSGTQFLLVSFDPARDTPETMGVYKKKSLPADSWKIISAGDGDTLEFAAALGLRYKPVAGGDFSHSNVVVVLDDGGREIFRQSGLGNPPGDAIVALQAKHKKLKTL